MENIVVSLTSYPKRIHMVYKVIESLWRQSIQADEILLYLSLDEFPQKENNLPSILAEMVGRNRFNIVWVEDNLKSHKKYYYALQWRADSIVITVDDDVIYSESLISDLLSYHNKFPQAVLARRVRVILKEGEQLAAYKYWDDRCSEKYLKSPRKDICAIGIGGVLYPPRCAKESWFEKQIIKSDFENQDDLWLKYQEIITGISVVYVKSSINDQYLEEAKETALWKENIYENDISIKKIFNLLKKSNENAYREWIACVKDKDCYILEKKSYYAKYFDEKLNSMGGMPIYIFGAGKKADIILNILDNFNMMHRINGILVSQKSGNPVRLKTLEITQIDELDRDKEFAVIYGIGSTYKKEVDNILNNYKCICYDLDIDGIAWCYQ